MVLLRSNALSSPHTPQSGNLDRASDNTAPVLRFRNSKALVTIYDNTVSAHRCYRTAHKGNARQAICASVQCVCPYNVLGLV